MRRALLIVVLAACGDDGGAPNDGRMIDAPIDAAPEPDAPPDAPVAPAGHTHYVIDAFQIPSNNAQARMYGLDLNGDVTVDNQLGMVIATLSTMGFNSQAGATDAVNRGTSITLVDLESVGFVTTSASRVALFKGTNASPGACANAADTVCRKHLAGNGSFTAAATPVNPPLGGGFNNGTMLAGPGALAIDLMFGGITPIPVQLIGARMKLTAVTTTAIGGAVIAGGLTQTEVNTKVIPGMREGFTATVNKDCTQLSSPPTCGCANGSSGASLLGLFDAAPKDCVITVAEVQNNTLIQSLLAPDVTIDGMPCLSVGVGATAVHGDFLAP